MVQTLKFEKDRDGQKTVVVSNIQRFSVHDGPGIRTVVFVQGCPLRCKWCQNPEDLKTKPQIMYYPRECIGCGQCLKACPNDATSADKDGLIQIDRERCLGCGQCVDVCHPGARKLSGKPHTVDEVYKEIIKDRVFYENSGGGVTLSGGEIAMFPDFAGELLKRCRENGINTAIETCGHTSWENLKQITAFCDLVLYDIKLVDPVSSKKWTGVDNRVILQNAKRLAASGQPMVIRVPLIPGVNDSDEEFTRIVEFTNSLGEVNTIHILPFHHLGQSKYESLDMTYPIAEAAEPEKRHVQKCAAIAEKYGLRVSIGGSGFLSEMPDKEKNHTDSGFIYKF